MSRLEKRRPEPRVTARSLHHGLRYLTRADVDLGVVLERHGAPPLWDREPGFPTLVHIILEQQVSLASARAAFDKLLGATDPLAPKAFLRLSDSKLRRIGFSGQKADYCRGLSAALERGELDLDALERTDTTAARDRLLSIRGIGPWTADIYLLMALGRRDVWPVGDLALAKSMQSIKGLSRRPAAEELEALAEPWRPWRSVAARLLWHHYLERQAGARGS